jgi:hypothetical protein
MTERVGRSSNKALQLTIALASAPRVFDGHWRARMTGALAGWLLLANWALAAENAGEKLLAEFSERHPELRIVKIQDIEEIAACAKRPRETLFTPVLVTRVTDRNNRDAFFLVATRSTPTRFGLLVWVKGDSHDEQWVVPLGPRILTGTGHGGPGYVWFLVSDCAGVTQGYRWNGRAFEYAGTQ